MKEETKMFKVHGLQPVWDMAIVDKEKTTAEFCVAEPVKKETVFVADKPWELGMAHYANVLEDNGKYRMYYISHAKRDKKSLKTNPKGTVECLLCGEHGRPALGKACAWPYRIRGKL